MTCVSAKIMTKPFLKWAGGKTQLLTPLLAKAPSTYDRYYDLIINGVVND